MHQKCVFELHIFILSNWIKSEVKITYYSLIYWGQMFNPIYTIMWLKIRGSDIRDECPWMQIHGHTIWIYFLFVPWHKRFLFVLFNNNNIFFFFFSRTAIARKLRQSVEWMRMWYYRIWQTALPATKICMKSAFCNVWRLLVSLSRNRTGIGDLTS